ncbi:MAG: hypothetical protein A2053_03390 [Deltaproteobacteria bacterium GWA2_50_8]|nr:MAG: hypothetical protein A2053_03390 [Deltaproteobacteria bacterium GWA2_50_8]
MDHWGSIFMSEGSKSSANRTSLRECRVVTMVMSEAKTIVPEIINFFRKKKWRELKERMIPRLRK